MKLGDIGVIAESIEKCIPEIAKNNGGTDLRNRLRINVNLSQEELDGINAELYEMTEHRRATDELPQAGSVELDLVGISFVLSVEEIPQ